MTRPACLALLLCLIAGLSSTELTARPPRNVDEAKVPHYVLPELLVGVDGRKVETADDWKNWRRAEILKQFEEIMFGKAPPAPEPLRYRVLSEKEVFDGKAVRKEIEITLADGPPPYTMVMLLYTPKSNPHAPAFLGLNFAGNHAVTNEPDVLLSDRWMRSTYPGVVDFKATEASRGAMVSRWPIEQIIDRGYALATIYYGDIKPDVNDDFTSGIHPYFYQPGQTRPGPSEWGTIAAWAWGLSRGLDYLQQDPAVDATRVAVIGHSRLGKTALWAGAIDPRFALVISNNSGCGGAALSRREFGETVDYLNSVRTEWFCGAYYDYGKRVTDLPFDQHMLIALSAPRPVYVASATLDISADPKGEFLSAYHADPVYRLLGTPGFGGDAPPAELPTPDQPLNTGTIGFHLRTGKHDLTVDDWKNYLDFADRHLKPRS